MATRGSPAGVMGEAASSSSTRGLSTAPYAAAIRGDQPPPPPHPPVIRDGYITYRLARRSDVSGIQRCNLATLPENYNTNFYINHMRSWPELAMVAEHVPEGHRSLRPDGERRRERRGEHQPSFLSTLANSPADLRRHAPGERRDGGIPQKEIVAYVLGKVDVRPVDRSVILPPRPTFPGSAAAAVVDQRDEAVALERMNHEILATQQDLRIRQGQDPQQRQVMEKVGHVTSLAVMSHARRLGIASDLLKQLHLHLAECYVSDAVGLHVRVSNRAAVGLYCDRLGYTIVNVIPTYYGDGEDAFFMRKEFPERSVRQDDVAVGGGVSSFAGRMQRGLRLLDRAPPPWEAGPPELRLPRHARVFRPEVPPSPALATAPPAPSASGADSDRSFKAATRRPLRAKVSNDWRQQQRCGEEDGEDGENVPPRREGRQITSGSK